MAKKDHVLLYKEALKKAKTDYYTTVISNGQRTQEFFSSLKKMTIEKYLSAVSVIFQPFFIHLEKYCKFDWGIQSYQFQPGFYACLLFKTCLPSLITKNISISLSSGSVPTNLKLAVVISNKTFLGKATLACCSSSAQRTFCLQSSV